MYITNMVKCLGGIPKMLVLCNFLKILMVQTKQFVRLLELIQLYKLNPLEKTFILTMYQNCTLALKYNFYEHHQVVDYW